MRRFLHVPNDPPCAWRGSGRATRLVLGSVLIGSTLGGLLDCSGDTTGPAPIAPTAAFWAVRLNDHAVMLALTAPYDTVQLRAMALTAAGTPFVGAGPVIYTTSDSTLQVSATGLVTAHYTTDQEATSQVIATQTAQSVTLADTAIFQVTATAPPSPLSTFSIQLNRLVRTAWDSDSLPIDQAATLYLNATNAIGDTINSRKSSMMPIYWQVSDPVLDSAGYTFTLPVSGFKIQPVTVFASTIAYGVVRRDSLRLTLEYPTSCISNEMSTSLVYPVNSLTPVLSFSPSEMTIGQGGCVLFVNRTNTLIDVVFDDSADVTNNHVSGSLYGNIAPFDSLISDGSYPVKGDVVRYFNVAGSFPFSSKLTGASGIINVQ